MFDMLRKKSAEVGRAFSCLAIPLSLSRGEANSHRQHHRVDRSKTPPSPPSHDRMSALIKGSSLQSVRGVRTVFLPAAQNPAAMYSEKGQFS